MKEILNFGENNCSCEWVVVDDNCNTNGKMYRVSDDGGNYKEYYPSGRLFKEYTLINNKLEGIGIHYYGNGHISTRTHYKNGEFNGLREGFYPNGNPHFKANFVNGYPQGKVKWWDNNGNIKMEEVWDKGKTIEMRAWDDYGRLTCEDYYDENGNLIKGGIIE